MAGTAKEEEKNVEGQVREEEGIGDDLLDLFTSEAEVVDPTLSQLTASLDEVDIMDLLEQVREIQDIMDQRRLG